MAITTNLKTRLGVVAAALLLGAAPARACPDDRLAGMLVQAWQQAQPVRGLGELSLADAACLRDRLVRALQPTLGKVVGYKAGLTNKAMQQRFGHDAPVRGVLLEKMLQPQTREALPAAYGARPVIEADLLVEVKDESINAARTHLDVLNALSRIFPFVELADLGIAEGEPVTAAKIVAINVGARGGVSGEPLAVEATQAFADALRDMRVIMSDETGKELANSPGAAILEHPLNAVLWLVHDLRKDGIRLKAGDVLSLGSFSPLLVPQPGTGYVVRYRGLHGDPRVAVRFR
jgi:2-keto-4-pentenoate hydratase